MREECFSPQEPSFFHENANQSSDLLAIENSYSHRVNRLKLKKLHRIGSTQISLVWDDGHIGPVGLRNLRTACPCAGCQGETILLRHYSPPEKKPLAPDACELKGAEVIGNYALKLSWGDGHDQGIFTWEHLRSLCECEACSAKKISEPPRENYP